MQVREGQQIADRTAFVATVHLSTTTVIVIEFAGFPLRSATA